MAGDKGMENERGKVGPEDHGWAPDAGPASEASKKGGERAFEKHETQDASTNRRDEPADDRSAMARKKDSDAQVDATDATAKTPLGVGQSTTRRGEDVAEQDGEEFEDLGTKGPAERPVGRLKD